MLYIDAQSRILLPYDIDAHNRILLQHDIAAHNRINTECVDFFSFLSRVNIEYINNRERHPAHNLVQWCLSLILKS